MSEPRTLHASDEALTRLVCGEPAADAEALRRHVAGCAECGARMAAMQRAEAAYLELHAALKAQDPAPPRAWEDLQATLPPARRSHWARGWMAAAAALIAVVALYRMNRAVPVTAAELLRKAAAVEPARSPLRRIRVRTAARSVTRLAVLQREAAASDPLEALFLSAHFSWQDPLSVRSFSAWREQLPAKQDRVRASEGIYEIHTTTESSTLAEAVLVLDAHDLHPLRETLQFTTERVEIAPEDTVESAAPVPAPAGVTPSSAGAGGAALELRVVAALHAIGADLGEPVQVWRRDAEVVVEATGLTPAREKQVRDALAPIAGVRVKVDSPEATALPPGAGGRIATAAGVRGQLEQALGEEGVNRILDASEAVMARTHALRGLSRRFPHEVEAQLADADRSVLANIRSEHVSGLVAQLRLLQAAVAPLIPKLAAAPAPPAVVSWQVRAERIAAAGQTVDHLLNRILAGGEDFASRAPELAEALRQLEAESAAAESRW
jgi:hypothetical protein